MWQGLAGRLGGAGGQRTRVSHRDLVDLIRVQPDLALAAFEDRAGQALLQQQRDAHGRYDRAAWLVRARVG